jgi:hypothetical protein
MGFLRAPTRTFPNNSALAAGLRVKLSAGYLVAAGATDVELGTLEKQVFATDPTASVILRTAEGTVEMIASGSATLGNPAYAAASGKVASSGTVFCGTFLLSTATADGDRSKCSAGRTRICRRQRREPPRRDGGTADADLGKPRAALKSQTVGTGDYRDVLKPPATLTADRALTAPGDFSANIKSDYTFSGTPAATATAGNAIPVGVNQVDVGAVTNDANDWMTLPAIASVPIGFTIWIAANAGTQLRAADAGEQQHEDQRRRFGRFAGIPVHRYGRDHRDQAHDDRLERQSFTKLGAVRTAVIPD